MKRIAPILPLICLAILTSACKPRSPINQSSNLVKVGEFVSLTGATADVGISAHNGATLAVEDANGAGGIADKKVVLVSEDNRSLQGESSTIVRKLIFQDKVVGLIGEIVSSRSLEAAPIAQQNKVPMISPASTAPKLTEVGDYIFRVCFIDPFQGSVLSKFALSKGWKKVALLTDVKSDYSISLTKTFKEHFGANGGSAIKEQSYSSGDKDFKAQLTSIKALNPDAIFIPGYYTEVGLIALQARQLGINVPLFGGDGWGTPDLTKIGGKSIEGCYFCTHFSEEDQNPVVQEFISRYQKRFNRKADVAAALGYDATKLMLEAIRNSSSTFGQNIRDSIASTQNFPGITGSIRLDENRNAIKPAVILEIRNGSFHYLETVKP